MREYTRALEALQAGTDHDENGQNAREIQQTEFKVQQALFTQRGSESSEETLERAMRDPEVAVRIFFLVLVGHETDRSSFDSKSCPTLSCSRSCSRLKKTRKHCRTISRMLPSDRRSRS